MNIAGWYNKNKTAVWAVAATLVFAVANSVLLLKDFYYLSLIPLAGLVLLLFVTRFETGLLCMALFTPFAINMALMPKMELSMPVEPMMILFTLMFFFRVLATRSYDLRLLRHPVTLCLLASMVWMLFTTCTSQLPFVSFKYWLARLWFVVPFFFAAAQIFRDKRRIRQFFWCYAIGLIAVILIATAKTLGNFSDLQTLHRVMKPFYNDHTAYGCVIALFIPAAFYFIFSRNSKGWGRLLSLAIMALLVVGLFFSYCRAAWLSVLGAIGVYVLVRMGMKVKWMVLLFGVAVGVFFVYQSDVLYKLGKNHQDSSYDLAGQIKSISNISTDASNLERLNRWASAVRMWKESPVVGCGPGTYQFLYASYQRSYQLSTISTNAGCRQSRQCPQRIYRPHDRARGARRGVGDCPVHDHLCHRSACLPHCPRPPSGQHGLGLHPQPAHLLHPRGVQQFPRHRQALGALLGLHRRGRGLGCIQRKEMPRRRATHAPACGEKRIAYDRTT